MLACCLLLRSNPRNTNNYERGPLVFDAEFEGSKRGMAG